MRYIMKFGTKNHQKNDFSFMKIFYFLLIACLIYITATTIQIIREMPGIQAIDMAWHVGSSVLFGQWGLHSFNDNWFMWFIQNLFYPPAEDFLVRTIRTITNLSPLQSFQIYISLVFTIYIWLFISITKYFKNRKSRNMFLLFIIFFLFLSKDSLVDFQWLWLIDLLFTWLTSQFLWWIGLLILIRELIWKKRDMVIVFSISFAILSHIIVWPVSFLLYCVFILFQKDRRKFWNIGAVLGVTSFLRIPFLLSIWWWTNANIVHSIPPFLIWIPIFLFLASYLKTSTEKSIFTTICIVLLPATISGIFKSWMLFPAFHYYRLSALALILFFVWIALLIDRFFEEGKENIAWGLFIPIFLMLLLTFNINSFDNFEEVLKPKSPESVYKQDIKHGSWRVRIIDNARSIDFHTDAMMSAYHPDMQFVKGLYWESNKQNELLSTYLANLINQNNIVTNFVSQEIVNCSLYNKVLDSFIKQYAISDLYYVKNWEIPFMRSILASCFSDAIKGGTSGYVFINSWKELEYNGRYFLHHQIKAKTWYENNNTLIVPFNAWKNNITKMESDDFMLFYIQSILAGSWQTIWLLNNRNYPESIFEINTINTGNFISMSKISQGKYRIFVDTDIDTNFIIKLYYYPWWKLISASGEKKEIFPIVGWMLARGKWELILQYYRPRYVKISYLISILTLLSLIYTIGKQQKIKKKS